MFTILECTKETFSKAPSKRNFLPSPSLRDPEGVVAIQEPQVNLFQTFLNLCLDCFALPSAGLAVTMEGLEQNVIVRVAPCVTTQNSLKIGIEFVIFS